MHWQTSRRKLDLDRPLVMGILNVTPDSFSDGGRFAGLDAALRRVEEMIGEGADIIDIGGESTRPGSLRVSIEQETERVVPAIEAISKRFDIPISIDTSKSEVASLAIDAGAEIINDISGLRWDERIAEVAAERRAGLVLMHSRGEFETMHSQPQVTDIVGEVTTGLETSVSVALDHGVRVSQIALDIGLGFGKSVEQNLELLAKLDKIGKHFPQFPILVGASRKSFIGKMLGNVPPDERLSGSIASAAIAVWNGAAIIRVHDVRETAEAIKVVAAIKKERQ
jgi:dihydropteroate synthase